MFSFYATSKWSFPLSCDNKCMCATIISQNEAEINESFFMVLLSLIALFEESNNLFFMLIHLSKCLLNCKIQLSNENRCWLRKLWENSEHLLLF